MVQGTNIILKKKAMLVCFFLILLVFISFFCVYIGDESNGSEESYVFVYANDMLGHDNTIEINDNHSKIMTKKSFILKGDISYNYYDYENKQLFLFGPGGLINVDIKKMNITQITTSNVSHVFKVNNNYGYVESLNKSSNFKSVVYLDLNGERAFDIDYLVNSVIFLNNQLYISNLPLFSEDANIVSIFDLNGVLIEQKKYSDFGRLAMVNDKISYITIRNYEQNNQKVYFEKALFSIYDEVDVYNDTLHLISFNTDNMTCDYYADEKEIMHFDNCTGFTKTSDTEYIFDSNKKFILYNIENQKQHELKVKRSKNHVLSYVFLF